MLYIFEFFIQKLRQTVNHKISLVVMGKKKGTKNVDNGRCRTIYDLHIGGMKKSVIARVLKMRLGTISAIIKRQKQGKTKKVRGRRQKLCERSLRRLRRFIDYEPFKHLSLITAEFNKYNGLQLSERTIRRCIHKLKIKSYVSVQKPFLTRKHITARIKWAKKHKKWTPMQWSTVAFTDESTFTVQPVKNHVRVWRMKSRRYSLKYVTPTFKSGYKTVNVWAAFSIRGRTPLVRIDGRFNQYKYKEILQNHLLPFMHSKHGGKDDFVLQEDNCGPHRAKSIAKYLQNEGVSRMNWPAQSPDLNPIENVWGLLKNRLRKLPKLPTNRDQLFEILQSEWNSLPDDYFASLADSMAARVRKVISCGGGSTKYS